MLYSIEKVSVSVSVSVSASFISAPPQQKQKEINKHIGLQQKKKKEEATKRYSMQTVIFDIVIIE